MIRRNELIRHVREALVKGVRRNMDRIFNTSQSVEQCFVPVDKGFLKHSGSKIDIADGARVIYSAPYAARVHFGGPAIPYTGTQVVHKQAHQRKAYIRKDGTRVSAAEVRAHDVKYENKRLIGFRPKLSKFERGPLIFRVLKEEPAREGTFFLSRAVQQEVQHLSEDIEFYLRRLERGAV